MGKKANAQICNRRKVIDWFAKHSCNRFKHSNLIVRDNRIRKYILNFTSQFNTKIIQIYIYREEHRLIIRIFSYNDYFTNWKSPILKQRKKILYRNRLIQRLANKYQNILGFEDFESYDWFKKDDLSLSKKIYYLNDPKRQTQVDCISLNKGQNLFAYLGKRLLALNLSYLLKTKVIIKNTNVVSKHHRFLLLKMFSSMGRRSRSPLPKYSRIKFLCAVYYSFLYKSSLLLSVYLAHIIYWIHKKKRRHKKLNPFLKSVKSAVNLMFGMNFKNNLKVKVIKITFRGHIHGSRRKRAYGITKGCISKQSFSNDSNYLEFSTPFFGIFGIRVCFIY